MKETEGMIIQFHPRKVCMHNSLLVDDTLEQIECKSCGEKLNPYFAIRKLMRLSETWKKQKAAADLAREEAEKKSKTKCQHCGKMTRVRVDVKDWKVFSRMQEEDSK